MESTKRGMRLSLAETRSNASGNNHLALFILACFLAFLFFFIAYPFIKTAILGNFAAFGTVNVTVRDIFPPAINLTWPDDNYPANATDLNFSYNVNDADNVSVCMLILDNIPVDYRYNVTKIINQSFNYTITPGNHIWKINCSDEYGNMGESETRNIAAGSFWKKVIPPEGVFQPYNASLTLTQEDTFSIRFTEMTIHSNENLSCDIKRADNSKIRITVENISLFNSNYTINYTLTSSDSIVNDANAGYLPWILKSCNITNSGNNLFSENISSRIYVHAPILWGDDEITRAVTCEGTPGVYFNNTAKCEFSEDTMFALQMRNGNPVEPSCFNNPGISCSVDYCKGIYFPTCDPLSYFMGYSKFSDDPNGYTTFNVDFAGYSTPVAYTRYVNSSGNFKLRINQALTNKEFSFTIYNLTALDSSSAQVYGNGLGGGTFARTQESDGSWNLAYYRFSKFTGTLDFVFNISFTDPSLNQNRTLKLVIAYGTETNQGIPSLFDVSFNNQYGLRNNRESESTGWTGELGGTCSDGVNNDFNYLGSGGTSWANSYDCYDFSCDGFNGASQTNEFGSGKTGKCNYPNEMNCTDQYDNNYGGFTDCHDANCFRNDTLGCPSIELICNDSINNDWDYTSSWDPVGWFNHANNSKYGIYGTTDLTDCKDEDCNNQVGSVSGNLLCNWGYERNCSDGFNNDALQLKDCELNTMAGSTVLPTSDNAEYDCSSFCRSTIVSSETGALCNNNKDDDYDAVAIISPYIGAMNTTGGGIDCRWGGYFGIGTSYYPDPDCDNQTLSNGKQCQLGRERNCSDSFDNDYDHDAAGMPNANWSSNIGAYQAYFNQTYSTGSDYDDYDCKIGPKAPLNESLNASWCFDGIDNNLDAYYFNGTNYVKNSSTGIDCADPSCRGVVNPLNSNQTCMPYEYNASDSFFQSLSNPGAFCNNGFDDDADNWKGWPLGGMDCRDPDCNKKFGMCDLQCYLNENITWDSCFDGIDNNFDMPGALIDCRDSSCVGMPASSNGAKCQALGSETSCDDSIDNDVNGNTDCADASCNGRVGGKIIGTNLSAYCSSENSLSTCFDGFDNDANGRTDCYDSGCNSFCNLSDINGFSPITLPYHSGIVAINSYTNAYIKDYTIQIRKGQWYNITFKETNKSTNAQWTIGTASYKFNKSSFNASSAHLEGVNSGLFSISENANGFTVNSNHADLPSGYEISFAIQSNQTYSSTAYEVTYAEEYQSKYSLNNYIYQEVDEDIPPVAQNLVIIPNSSKVLYGGSVYLRANMTDNYRIGMCSWNASYTGGSIAPASSTQCRASFNPSQEGLYNITVIPVDYYSNQGASLSKVVNLDIVPTSASIEINKIVPFYNKTAGETLTINATFNLPSSDSLGTCEVIAANDSGTEFSLDFFSATGSSCYKSGISLAALGDSSYRVFVRVTETTDGDVLQSSSKNMFVCSQMGLGICAFADYNLDGKPDSCPPVSGVIVTSINPADNYNQSVNLTTFECTAYSSSGLSNMTLNILNSNGSIYYTNTSMISGASNSSSWDVNLLLAGSYNWSCSAYSVLGTFGSSSVRVLKILNPIGIQLLSPIDGLFTSDNSVVFNYNANDSFTNLLSCSLYINSIAVDTRSINASSYNGNFSYTFAAGIYSWLVRCSDYAGNSLNSSSRNIVITGGGGVPGGGGGGGGMPGCEYYKGIYYIYLTDKNKMNITVPLSVKNNIQLFLPGNEKHPINIMHVEKDYVNMKIHPTSIEQTFLIGETKEIDINGDSIADISLQVVYVDDCLRAVMIFKYLPAKKELPFYEIPLRKVKEIMAVIPISAIWWMLLAIACIIIALVKIISREIRKRRAKHKLRRSVHVMI